MLNPAQFRILLAGPRVSRLHPFFAARGYLADACVRGSEAMALLEQSPRHLVLVELDLDDMLCGDLLIRARQKNLAGAVLLLEDPAKTGLIVSTLVRGVDGFVAVPPDEAFLFRLVERHLLAQWAIAQSGEVARDTEEKARLERQLAQERLKVTDLVKELGTLRTELSELKKAQKKKPTSSEGNGKPISTEAPPRRVNDERTSPRGFTAPSKDLLEGGGDDLFEENSSDQHTMIADPRSKSQPPSARTAAPAPPAGVAKKNALEDADLMKMLDDETGSTRIDPSIGATQDDDDDFLKLDD